MMSANFSRAEQPCVGVIANPVSARDIRRIVANASNLQTAERVNIVLRILTTLAATGVGRVMMMPDRAGLAAMLSRSLNNPRNQRAFPRVDWVPMDVASTVEDTFTAARTMQEAGVTAIIVLGGDGTHRAVVRELIDGTRRGLPETPIAGLSTGTNNAFPEMREPTVTALAVGLYASGRLGAGQSLASNKVLEVSVDGGRRRDLAIVDAVIANEHYVGARALWKAESLSAVYLAFADPEAIGLSAIGGLLCPVGRSEPGGLMVSLSDSTAGSQFRLRAPIAPGLMTDLGIAGLERMPAGQEFPVAQASGVIALDGERELTFDAGEHVGITLREGAFQTVDVARCMHIAARDGLLRHSPANH